MRSRIWWLVGISLILEVYTFFGLRSLIQQERHYKWFYLLYLIQMFVVGMAYYKMYQGMMSGAIVRNATVNLALGIVLTSLVTKLVFCVLMILHDGGRLIAGGALAVKDLISGHEGNLTGIPGRRDFLTKSAALLAGIPLTTMLYGITRGKYHFKVEALELFFDDLPPAFDGYKIVQISDIHAGSFDNVAAVSRGVAMINAEQADVVLFTGDLINSEKDEVDPYIDVFNKIESKEGTYAVLGNHDYYGLYGIPESEQESYWSDLLTKIDRMGFRLLNNTAVSLQRGNQNIQLLGVENWGAGRWFPKKGDLDAALSGVASDDFCVLMSHDPTHWDEKVLSHTKKIHLTLSGHTHGMQFGINLPGFKWSPVKYRYPRWMGLYEEEGQKLYVNRGFGVLGFPGRVGMWPEITSITLRRAV